MEIYRPTCKFICLAYVFISGGFLEETATSGGECDHGCPQDGRRVTGADPEHCGDDTGSHGD